LHWVVLLWHGLIGGLGALLGLGLVAGTFVTTGNDLGSGGTAAAIGGVLLFGAGLAILLIGILKRAATEIAVTNKRVLIKTGFFSRKTIEIFLSKIESVVVDESFLGKTLGFGTVTVRGTGGTPEAFERVADPLEFRRQVQTQIEGSPTEIRTA
ncbi:MAG TPA: PH domain-containing protein, partial [Candidatus Binatia bacterium]|nr:PH domain-containing protein [Candidatus Binatia bacterium]